MNTEDRSVEFFELNTINAPVSAQKGVLSNAAGAVGASKTSKDCIKTTPKAKDCLCDPAGYFRPKRIV